MIWLSFSGYQMNGEYVDVLEVWRSDTEDGKYARMICSIPMDFDELIDPKIYDLPPYKEGERSYDVRADNQRGQRVGDDAKRGLHD